LHVCREVLTRWWRLNHAEVVAPVCWWLSWCFCCYFAGPRALSRMRASNSCTGFYSSLVSLMCCTVL
jgi:hypothetical protein